MNDGNGAILSEEKEKNGLGLGLGLGSELGLGFSISSRKPPLQLGQVSSEEAEGDDIATVRLHW